MNHLHQVIDSAKERTMTIQETIPKESELKFVSELFRLSANAVCFNGGDAEDIGAIGAIVSLIKLPYDVCWIEFNARGTIAGAMCEATSKDGVFNVLPFLKGGGSSWSMLDIMVIDASSDNVKYLTTEAAADTYRAIGGIVCRFLSALNCTNVRKIEERPSAALNKARIRRGKQPLFSTWTLSISIPKERRDSVALGGSHASPRVHLRRGHPREYKPGLWTWVQPCAVGAKENGMIHKDYKAVVSKP